MRHDAFSFIEDQNTAYWLGFLAADGCCVHKTKDQLMIGLSVKDRGHLEKFANFLDYPTSLIADYDSKCSNGKYYSSSKTVVTSLQIRTDLEKYGIIVSKSNYNIDFLSYIPEKYKLAFICGYFDGDGWFVDAQTFGFGFCGNESTMRSISKYLQENYSIEFNSIGTDSRSPNTHYLRTQAKEKIKKFIEIYLSLEDKCDLLERKKKVAYHVYERCLESKTRSLNKEKSKEEILCKEESICPSCGCLFIPNYKGQKHCSQICAHKAQQRTDRPSREELKELIRTFSFLQVGRIYNVSDNAIRKWCKAANLPSKVTEIKQYSDEEWEKI